MSKEEKIVGQCKSSGSKELEALERGIIEFEKDLEDDCNNEWLKRVVAGMKKCYHRLESIDNANPSEALEETLRDIAYDLANDDNPFLRDRYYGLLDLKQALIKAQEQEKEIAYIEKIKTMMKQKDCVLRYIESEDCFAVKTILSDGWYKLTPEFVENNVREEIKPLPLIEKNKQLKEENAEYKKVLDLFKKKCLHTDNLNEVATCLNYNVYKERMSKKYDTTVVKIDWNDKVLLDYLYLLTEDEFDLLKRYICQSE